MVLNSQVIDKFKDKNLDSQLSDYEKERQKNIQKNNEVLEKLGLMVVSDIYFL